MDDFTQAPGQDPSTFLSLQNVIVGANNNIRRRWGYTRFDSIPMGLTPRRIFETHFANGRNRFVMTASDETGVVSSDNKVNATNENGDFLTTAPIFIPSQYALHPHASTSRNYVYFTDGISDDLLKWDTNDDPSSFTVSPDTLANLPSVSKWGIDTPTDTFTATAGGAGNITLDLEGRDYYVSFRNSVTGHTSHPIGFATVEAPQTNIEVDLAALPISSDPQVDQRVIMATSDGGAHDTLYEVAIIDDNTTTTYTDTKSEEELTDSPIWAELGIDGREIGVFNNTPPSDILVDGAVAKAHDADSIVDTTTSCMHRGRCYIMQGHFLFWSKTLSELTTSTGTVTGRWEEAWPARNQTSISSDGSEIGTALVSDDVNLYIFTNRTCYVHSGDNPAFSPPRALFHEAGALNQEVVRLIFHNGQSVGMMWMTPDKRVLRSNFNTYLDVGNDQDRHSSIQSALNNLTQSTIVDTACSTFIADGENEFYLLAVGHPSAVIFVYNVVTGAWMRWFSSYSVDTVYAMSYMLDKINGRPLPIFATTTDRIYRWNKDTPYDRSFESPQLSAPVIEFNWLDMGDPAITKVLNEVEVMTSEPSMLLDVYGANTRDQFVTPVSIASVVPFVAHPLGPFKASLAGYATKYRFYRIVIVGIEDTTADDILSYISIEFAPTSYH